MLAGVVVGAIVAGFGQVVNAWLQDRRRRGRTLREERRRAYVGMIGTSSQAQATIELRDLHRVESDRVRRDVVDVRKKAAQVRLVGPADTADRAQTLLDGVLAFDRGDLQSDGVESRRDAFLALAQRDLEIPTK